MQQAKRLDALRTLAEGRLRDWRGLPPGCTRAEAEQAFGSSGQGPDGAAMLGGTLMAFRRYPPARGAPHGLTVWYAGDRIWAVEINAPHLEEPLARSLGAPDSEGQSMLGVTRTHRIFAARGLAAHLRRNTEEVLRLYAFEPTSLENYLRSPLAHVEERRVPLR